MCKIDGYNYKTAIPVRFADLDANGYVSHSAYLTYFEIARMVYCKEVIQWDLKCTGIIVRRCEIDFIKPISLNDEIYAYVRTASIGKTSFHLDYILVKKTHSDEEICTYGHTQCVAYDFENHKSIPVPDYQRMKMQDFEAINAPAPVYH